MGHMSVIIRPANENDAVRCAQIYAPYVTDTWVSFETAPPEADEMANRIASYGKSHAWLVAERSGEVVGYAYGSPHRTRAAYRSSCDVAVYCDRSCRGKGVGKSLYAALLPVLGQTYHAAFAGIAMPNDASVRLHQAMGFTRVGLYREVGYKLGDWRDVEWWQRLL